MKWSATIANSLWIGSSLPAWRSFKSALHRPEEVQRTLLRSLIGANAQSAYGRAHRFGEINTYEDFAANVPIIQYEEIAPWIERVRNLEPRVLTCEPVTHLIPTGGSTGARKLIPFTRGLQRQFNRAINPWVAGLARQHPGILFGPAYWSITPVNSAPEAKPSQLPIGFADDAAYLGGLRGWLVRSAMAVPNELRNMEDLNEFRFRTLLCLLRERDLRLISVWHPSFLTLLLDAIPEHWDRIVRQLNRESCARARELERLNMQKPETLWPDLRVISCWGDGHAELALKDLQQRFPNVSVQAKGLLATEAFITIPFAGYHPVAVSSHFFEFLDAHGRIHLAHQLRDGEEYEVVVSTAGGLWRYRLGDRVEVNGFLGSTPSLRFLGRAGKISDLFGEKLSEAFVANVLRRTLDRFQLSPRFAFLAPEQVSTGWRYTFYVEGAIPPAMTPALDQALRENPQYDYCRALGQLQPAGIFEIGLDAYEMFTNRLVSEGQRLGEIKPAALYQTTGWSKTFSKVA